MIDAIRSILDSIRFDSIRFDSIDRSIDHSDSMRSHAVHPTPSTPPIDRSIDASIEPPERDTGTDPDRYSTSIDTEREPDRTRSTPTPTPTPTPKPKPKPKPIDTDRSIDRRDDDRSTPAAGVDILSVRDRHAPVRPSVRASGARGFRTTTTMTAVKRANRCATVAFRCDDDDDDGDRMRAVG